MKSIKCILLLFICLTVFFGSGVAQNTNTLDSLSLELERAENDSVKIEIMLQLSTLFRSQDFKKSMEYSLSAMELAQSVQDERLLSKVLVNAGVSFFQKGLYDEAVRLYKQQLEVGQKIGDENIIGRAYFNLGTVRLVLEDYGQSLEYFSNALRYINSHNEKEHKKLNAIEQAIINNAFGVVYTGLKDFKQAESYFILGMRDTKGVQGAEYSYCQLGNNYADLLLKKGEWSKAKDILVEILPIQEKIQNKPGVISVLLSLGKVEEANGNYGLAKSYYNRALALSYSINGFSHKKHLTAALSQLFDKINKPDSALYYLNLSLAF